MDLATELLQTIADRLLGLDDLKREFGGLRGEFHSLKETVADNGRRLDRLETLSEATHATLLGIEEQGRFTVRYLKTLAERDSELGTEVSSLKRRVDALEEHTGLKDDI